MTKTNPLIRIYGIFPYDRGAKARWLLTELGIPFENHWFDREKREFEGPEYLKVNPMGRIPAMTIEDTNMFESGAICAYLADRFGLAPAITSPERPHYAQWMHFADATLDPLQTRIMIIEDIPAGEVKTAKETALLSDVQDVFQVLDGALSKSQYLVGGAFSAADICVGYHATWLRLWPEFEAIVSKFPRVVSYLERLQKMPSAIKAEVFTYEE